MTKPNVAASSYLNTAPLCYSFLEGRQRDFCNFLSDRAPSRCAEMLREGKADAALIPVIEYQRIEGLKAFRGPCVASKSKVRSVVLASKVPIERVSKVTLDTSSRTSATLIKIILEKFYGTQPVYSTSSPDISQMLETNDAALIIGDPAMLIDRQALKVYDLAEEWRKHTGLPFVFAFWAVRKDSPFWAEGLPGTDVDFETAKREGLDNLNTITRRYSEELGLPIEDLREYLTVNISFDLDDDCARGMTLYFKLAEEAGLIEKFIEPEFY